MGWFPRRHRGSQVVTSEALYQVPVAFGSSLTFRCDCGRGMYPSAVVNGTETSKTIRMTCGGCKRVLDVTLDAGYAIKAFTRTAASPDKDPDMVALSQVFRDRVAMWRTPEPVTARESLTASLSRDPDLAARPDHLMTLVDDILLDLQDNGLTIVASSECDETTAHLTAPFGPRIDKTTSYPGWNDDAEVLGRARPDRPTGW